MPLSKIVRGSAVVIACTVAAAGLSQSISTSAGSASVGKDFIILGQNAASSVEHSLQADRQAKTLSDWEFTTRQRPIKCRFVN